MSASRRVDSWGVVQAAVAGQHPATTRASRTAPSGTLVTVGSASLDVAVGEDLGKVAVTTVAETAGQIAGGWAGGALVGAVAGSEVPVAGTVVGAVIGGFIGGMAAGNIAESSMSDG